MAYTAWSVVFGEQPTAAKWNELGENDAAFNDGSGFAAGALGSDHASLANGILVQAKSAGFSAVATGSTTIPMDDSIPQQTEGNEFMTVTITPKSASNKLIVRGVCHFASSIANQNLILAVFRDSAADAIFVSRQRSPTIADAGESIPFEVEVTAGSTAATTFKVRCGGNGAATFTFNGAAGARLFGAVPKSHISVVEYKA